MEAAELDVVGSTAARSNRHGRRTRRTAAATVFGCAIVIGLAGCSGSPAEEQSAANTTTTAPAPATTVVVSTTTLPPQTSTTTSTTAAPASVAGDNGWALVPRLGEDTYTDFPIRAIATGPDGIVAAGVAVTEQSGDAANGQPLAWSTTDGVNWAQTNLGTEPGEVNDIVWGNDIYIAVGGSGLNASVWSSVDGAVWDQLTVPSPDRTFARMNSVVAVADGFFAAGFERSWPQNHDWEEADSDAVVWFSADGIEWERIDNPVFDEPGFQEWGDGGYSEIVGAAATEWGLVFAGESSVPGTGYPHRTTVWVLSEEWARVIIGNDDQIRGVTAADGIAVVFGSSEASPSADAVFYVSSNGSDWQLAGGDLAGVGVHDGIQLVNDIVFVPGDGLLAIGTDEKDFSTVGGAAVWIADPGPPLHWTREDHDGAVFGDLTRNPLETMLRATVRDGRVVVVGGQAQSVDLGDGGWMCCRYVPSAWVRNNE